MAKRKKGNAPLWSVARVQDPRFPGITVRVTELTGGGGVLYACYRRHGRQTMRSLKLRRKDLGSTAKAQREKARAIALDVIEALANPQQDAGDKVETADVLTLGALADLYEKHGLPGVGLMYARAQVTKLRRFVEFLGADKPVVSLSKSDIKRFAAHRAQDVGLNTVAGDLVGLKIALGFAQEYRRLDGSPLLESDPLARVRLPREEPKRPWCATERYAALQAVADRLPGAFGIVLAVAWESGHRVGAILKLQWKDVSFETSEYAPSGTIRWYAGERSDRKKKDATVPLNADARKALEGWRAA